MIVEGDALMWLRSMDSESVQCCITSPPYFGLRDYGQEGQIGLEPTPDEYVAKLVAVFGEVKRVLRDDGTLWLNLGDSYAMSTKGADGEGKQHTNTGSVHRERSWAIPRGTKPKDLLGIPWMVAFALRQPYYDGRIRDELDRVWLAAMIDAEGCMYVHRRKAGQSNGQGYERKADSFGSGLEICNTSEAIVRRCLEITGRGSISMQGPDENARRKQTLYRWNLRTNECRDVIREVYPYLVAKQHEARLVLACPSSGPQATEAWEAVKSLHGGGVPSLDFKPPASMHEPGWYLRSEIVWNKPNPMPESVTDRPTKAHEQVFLLSKSARYYYNAGAIREADLGGDHARTVLEEPDPSGGLMSPHMGIRTSRGRNGDGRNKRSVWTIATQPYPAAHFATFPPKLIEPMVLAGCPRGGLVLDPFAGSGTTLQVAVANGRRAVGIELNPEYVKLAERRLVGVTSSMFDPVMPERGA